MRAITVKYSGECRKCGTTLNIGDDAIYERHVGLFCLPCEPKETKEIRTYRQEAANHKADKYDEWASKREHKAEAQLNSYPETRHDWAFITQPGRIPLREHMNRADDRACESLNIANNMRNKADSLRHVRVKGDADKRWQSKRDYTLTWLKQGMEVDSGIYGIGTVLKINKKTAKIGSTGTSKTYITNVDLAFLSQLTN